MCVSSVTLVFVQRRTGMAERLPCQSYVRQRWQNKIWFLGIYRMIDVISFRDWLYRDATILMERKHIKFYQEQELLAAA